MNTCFLCLEDGENYKQINAGCSCVSKYCNNCEFQISKITKCPICKKKIKNRQRPLKPGEKRMTRRDLIMKVNSYEKRIKKYYRNHEDYEKAELLKFKLPEIEEFKIIEPTQEYAKKVSDGLNEIYRYYDVRVTKERLSFDIISMAFFDTLDLLIENKIKGRHKDLRVLADEHRRITELNERHIRESNILMDTLIKEEEQRRVQAEKEKYNKRRIEQIGEEAFNYRTEKEHKIENNGYDDIDNINLLFSK